MVIVTVELVSGVTGERRELGQMVISNDGSGTELIGNYCGVVKAEYGIRKFKRTGFRRKTQSVWTLIGSVLGKLGHVKDVGKVELVRD